MEGRGSITWFPSGKSLPSLPLISGPHKFIFTELANKIGTHFLDSEYHRIDWYLTKILLSLSGEGCCHARDRGYVISSTTTPTSPQLKSCNMSQQLSASWPRSYETHFKLYPKVQTPTVFRRASVDQVICCFCKFCHLNVHSCEKEGKLKKNKNKKTPYKV